jgi:hypothetical protein
VPPNLSSWQPDGHEFNAATLWRRAVSLRSLALLMAIAITSLGCSQSNTPFNSHKMGQVVERVKRLGMKPGETLYLRLDSLAAPASLHTRNRDAYPRGQEAGNVWASGSPRGELTVIVVTVDKGHAGSQGYGYSETKPREARGLYSLAEDAEHSVSCTDPQHRVGERLWEVWSCETD